MDNREFVRQGLDQIAAMQLVLSSLCSTLDRDNDSNWKAVRARFNVAVDNINGLFIQKLGER